MQEGDTPSFLHLVSALRGLNDPEKPDQAGWGGQFVRPDPSQEPLVRRSGGPAVGVAVAQGVPGGVCDADRLVGPAAASQAHHRLVVLSDIEADPDDTQSFVRLLLYSNSIDIEALDRDDLRSPEDAGGARVHPHG